MRCRHYTDKFFVNDKSTVYNGMFKKGRKNCENVLKHATDTHPQFQEV